MSRPVTLPAIVTDAGNVEVLGRTRQLWRASALEPGQAVELQRLQLQLEQGLRPCEPMMVKWHVGKLLNHWSDRKSDGEKDEIIVDWCADLGEFSETHIAQACREWRKTQKWKPQVAEIVAICERLFQRDIESRRRIRILLGLDKPRSWESLPPPKEPAVHRDPAEMRNMLNRLNNKLLAPGAANREPVDVAEVAKSLATRDPDQVQRLTALRSKTAQQG